MLINKLLILLLLISTYLLSINGESPNEKTSVHPLTNLPHPSEDIVTAAYIPLYPDQKIPIGETITILCHFVNDGTSFVNITSIIGSLNSPFDYNFYVQNFSIKSFGLILKSGEEITLDYQFQVHPSFEPVDFTLSTVVFYETENDLYSTTFFNQTVELYQSASDFDIVIIGQVLFGILSSFAVIFMTFFICFPDRPIFKQNKTKDKSQANDFEEKKTNRRTKKSN